MRGDILIFINAYAIGLRKDCQKTFQIIFKCVGIKKVYINIPSSTIFMLRLSKVLYFFNKTHFYIWKIKNNYRTFVAYKSFKAKFIKT